MKDPIDQKLRRVEALIEGATTPGERAAAEAARGRLLARRARGSSAGAARRPRPIDPGPVASVDYPLPPGVGLPPLATLRALLAAWSAGELGAAAVRRSAERVCDENLLPICPLDDPRAIQVEIWMQLSAMRHQPLERADAAALSAFLAQAPGEALWGDWFRWLERRFSAAR